MNSSLCSGVQVGVCRGCWVEDRVGLEDDSEEGGGPGGGTPHMPGTRTLDFTWRKRGTNEG